MNVAKMVVRSRHLEAVYTADTIAAMNKKGGRDPNPFLIDVTPLGNRLYDINTAAQMLVYLDDGTVYNYFFLPKFTTNFRSGGLLVDRFIDQIGNQPHQILWIIHDGAYTPCDAVFTGDHPISKDEADELLRACLKFVGEPAYKCQMIYFSVHNFGKSAYYDDDELTDSNRKLFNFHKEQVS